MTNDSGVALKINKKRNNDEGNEGGKKKKLDHESEERKRREMFVKLYADLHALLPHLPTKAYKATILDSAITSIKSLEQTLQNLQKKRLERFHGLPTNAKLVPHQNHAINNEEHLVLSRNLAINYKEPHLANNVSSKRNIGVVSSRDPIIFETCGLSNVTINVCGSSALINICSLRKPGLLTAICFTLEKYSLEVVSISVNSNDVKTMIMIQVNDTVHEFAEGFRYAGLYKKVADEIMINVNLVIKE